MLRIMALLSCAAVAAAAVGGCGSKRTYSTPEGEVTVTERGGSTEVTVEGEEGKLEIKGDSGEATMTSEEGTVTVRSGDEAAIEEIGIPLYPGAKAEGSVSWSGEEGGQRIAQAQLMTPEPVDKVKAFYQKQLPKAAVKMEMSTEELQMVQIGSEEDGVQKLVVISREKGKDRTNIMLHRQEGAE